MLIIGEKLNSAIPNICQIINDKDAAAVKELALKQVEAGADYLDLNTAHCNEVDDMEWLVRTVQEVTDIPLCIDSTSAEAIKKGLDTVAGDKSKVMINSVSLEKNRLEGMLPLIIEYQCPVIGLTADENGIPKTAEDRVRITERMIEILTKYNYDLNNLYIDPLVLPLAASHTNASIFFQSVAEIKRLFKVKTVSGLSNISYNMPKRKLINRYFLTISMAFGMDAAILDPLDKKIMTAVTTTNLLLGNDRFGKDFLMSYRKGKLED
ncbi:5-methyltetrahydrofolate:corrinoid/iron-sulfur protein co-methyltransferase [Neomoorella glycerini]|uniref:5-methyltetrahydrofolate:corrinoid/iron-sulfur protein co-methyltransferase n=1 Tax=Neomoorella glycerini TaxID=55779 RepID=A0A6I5ZMP6_9FIRM|nr:dihydropteroate synthase [Moorella glycerini]QGP91138.1 5-methyltetrahydrofolate:corrinoid/iron-sulfur protein co-methyltransferase [Moorella glycerini]